MMLARRRFLGFAAMAAALPRFATSARAQTFPSRPVRLVVGFPAGGPNDILGRLIAQWLPPPRPPGVARRRPPGRGATPPRGPAAAPRGGRGRPPAGG